MRPIILLLPTLALTLAIPVHLSSLSSGLDQHGRPHRIVDPVIDSWNEDGYGDGPKFDNSDYVPSPTESTTKVLDMPRPLPSVYLMNLDDSDSDSDSQGSSTELLSANPTEVPWKMDKPSFLPEFMDSPNMRALFLLGSFMVVALTFEILFSLLSKARSRESRIRLEGYEKQLYASVGPSRREGKSEMVQSDR